MSKNKVLDYLSAVYEEMDLQRDTIDVELYQFDDGETHSVAEGKAEREATHYRCHYQAAEIDGGYG